MNMNDAFVGSLIFNKNSGGGAHLVTKTIVESGIYNASDDGADGYSSVIVNVPRGGLNTTEFVANSSTYTTT